MRQAGGIRRVLSDDDRDPCQRLRKPPSTTTPSARTPHSARHTQPRRNGRLPASSYYYGAVMPRGEWLASRGSPVARVPPGQQGYRALLPGGYVDAVKVRPREAADQAAAEAFLARHNSAGDPGHMTKCWYRPPSDAHRLTRIIRFGLASDGHLGIDVTEHIGGYRLPGSENLPQALMVPGVPCHHESAGRNSRPDALTRRSRGAMSAARSARHSGCRPHLLTLREIESVLPRTRRVGNACR